MSKNTDLGNLVNGLFVSSTRNVGIGTTSPNGPLSVQANTGNTAIRLIGTAQASSNNAGIFWYDSNDSTFNGYLGNFSGSFDIYNQRSTPMVFSTAGTERLRITSAGNVGIGTDSPNEKFQVQDGNLSTYHALNGAAAGYGIAFYTNGGGSKNTIASIYPSQVGTSRSGNLLFLTSNGGAEVERMRITSVGNVGIGTTTPSVRLQIDGTNDQERFRLQNTDSPSYMAFSEQNITMWRPNDSGSAFVIRTQAISGTWTGGGGGIEFRPLNTLRMTIGPTGNIGAPSGTNIYNASDARLKQNISQITYGLDAIAALNPVKFNWVDGFEPSEDGKDMLGFVAQEVLEVLPEAIEAFGSNSITIGDTIIDNPLRVNEKFIIPVLVKAIQELKAEIEILKQK